MDKPKQSSAQFTERSLEEAVDELRRELQVRDRCFPGWVADGRIARTDARDRYDRLKTAIIIMERDHPELGADTEAGDKPY